MKKLYNILVIIFLLMSIVSCEVDDICVDEGEETVYLGCHDEGRSWTFEVMGSVDI